MKTFKEEYAELKLKSLDELQKMRDDLNNRYHDLTEKELQTYEVVWEAISYNS